MRRRAGKRDRPRSPTVEALEQRCMLDAGLGDLNSNLLAVVVGRTISSSTVAGGGDRRETITYTVYNEQSADLEGVLLKTTLQPGVTIVDASLPPNRDGQELAWSLGTIGAFDRASVTLTVTPASPGPLALDGGATAFATVNTAAVSDSAPAATLGVATIAPERLAATPDANSNDPFIQEVAARLDYDPQAIFDFLHTQIGYESYAGSVRGARGTLWSGAGNALDVASLGVALLRASGVPAQYVQGTLTTAQAQTLIASMFPNVIQTVGILSPSAALADPVNDPKLLAETRAHTWFQLDTGNGLRDADPLMPGAAIGQAFTAAQGTFAEVPDALREKTTIRLIAEITNTATSLFGIPGQSRTTVLDHTFNDVDLVGRPVTIGHFTNRSALGSLFSAITNTYSPFLAVGDLANPDPSQDDLIRGQDYQEFLTNFPFGTQILTGLFLEVDLSGPGGPRRRSSGPCSIGSGTRSGRTAGVRRSTSIRTRGRSSARATTGRSP